MKNFLPFFFAVFLLGFLFFSLRPTLAADTCQGYQTDSKGIPIENTVEEGICYYWTPYDPGYSVVNGPSSCGSDTGSPTCNADRSGTLPDCTTMTANDYHHNPNYHGISDSVVWCGPHGGNEVKCCAPNVQTTPVAPPPPCSNFANPSLPGSSKCLSVNTGLGSIPTDPSGLVGALLAILLSVSGGIALLLIIASGYQLMASQGNPEKVKEARERLTSAIVGLVFIIFSVLILKTLTVNILHIPGFH